MIAAEVVRRQMDLIVLDDATTISENFAPVWAERGVTVFQTDDPELLSDPLNADSIPVKWDRVPDATHLAGVVLDIDLGGHLGVFGGVVGAARLAAARRKPGSPLADKPVVLRTQDLYKERDLAAVLIAELLGEPISWWDSGRDNDGLIEFLSRHAESPSPDVSHLNVRYVRPLPVVNQTKNGTIEATTLAGALLAGDRWKYWIRTDTFNDGIVKFRGTARNVWENMDKIVTAVAYMLETNQPLHRGHVVIPIAPDEQYRGPLDVNYTDEAIKKLRRVNSQTRQADAGEVRGEYRRLLVNRYLARLLVEAELIEANIDE